MESLLANYASSSDEEDQQQQKKQSHENSTEAPKISNFFSSLPQPKSHNKPSSSPFPDSNPKRIIQFKLPLNPSLIKPLNDDDEDDEKKKPQNQSTLPTQTSSVKSLFSMLPAPKNSLGLGAAAGAGRRSIVVETTNMPASSSDGFQTQLEKKDESGNREELGHHGANWGDGPPTSNWGDASATAGNENYGYYHGGYDGGYGYYDGSAAAAAAPAMALPATVAPDSSGEGLPRVPGKRGRDEIPVDIVEVKQDELMKNRPREDQVKLTGIAFGPAYQPVSTKGKPTKLHKRKHQIGSLYYDMKQKEMELAERRSKGFLTKAETQAKYGW